MRHEPWLYELELDEGGWTSVESFLAAMREEFPAWPEVSEKDLVEMIATSSKQRHEISDGRIRAPYGHSVPGKLAKEPAEPPMCLFHGTAPKVVATIRQEGLLPMRRQYVHLSTDSEMATAVGRRKASEPVILAVRAQAAFKAGVQFYVGNDKVWLADGVPPAFIDFLRTRPL